MKRKIIIFLVFLIFLCLSYYFIKVLDNMVYLEKWNIKLPISLSEKSIISGFNNPNYFGIKKYTRHQKFKLLKNNQFKILDKEKINIIYEKAIQSEFFKSINEKEVKEANQYINQENIFSPENYYYFLEHTETNKYNYENYEFVLLILNSKENKLYIFQSFKF